MSDSNQSIPQHISRFQGIIEDYFRNEGFSKLYAEIVGSPLPARVNYIFCNLSGKEPLPSGLVLEMRGDATIAVDVSHAVNCMYAVGLLRVDIDRLHADVRRALELQKRSPDTVIRRRVLPLLVRSRDVSGEGMAPFRDEVEKEFLSCLKQDNLRLALQALLAESTDYRRDVLRLNYRLQLGLDVAAELPGVASLYDERLEANRQRIRQECEAAGNIAELEAIVDRIGQGLADGTFLAEDDYLSKELLLSWLNAVKEEKRDRMRTRERFFRHLEKFREQVQQEVETPEHQTGLAVDWIVSANGLADQVRQVDDTMAIAFVELLITLVRRMLAERPKSRESLGELTGLVYWLGNIYRILDHGLTIVRERCRPADSVTTVDGAAAVSFHPEVRENVVQLVVLLRETLLKEVLPALNVIVTTIEKQIRSRVDAGLPGIHEGLGRLLEYLTELVTGRSFPEIDIVIVTMRHMSVALRDRIIDTFREQVMQAEKLVDRALYKMDGLAFQESLELLTQGNNLVASVAQNEARLTFIRLLLQTDPLPGLDVLQRRHSTVRGRIITLLRQTRERDILCKGLEQSFLSALPIPTPDRLTMTVKSEHGLRRQTHHRQDPRAKFALALDAIVDPQTPDILLSLKSNAFRTSKRWLIRFLGRPDVDQDPKIMQECSPDQLPTIRKLDTAFESYVQQHDFDRARETALEMLTKSKLRGQALLLELQWIERAIGENTLTTRHKWLSDKVRVCDPVGYIEELAGSGGEDDAVLIRDFLSRKRKITYNAIRTVIRRFFSAGDCLFLPAPCPDTAKPLSRLLREWMASASTSVTETIYSFMFGMTELMELPEQIIARRKPSGAASPFERRLFDLLYGIFRTAGTGAKLQILKSSLAARDKKSSLERVISDVLRPGLEPLGSRQAEAIITLIREWYQVILPREYARFARSYSVVGKQLLRLVLNMHLEGVIHGEIKPDHVMVTQKGINQYHLRLFNFAFAPPQSPKVKDSGFGSLSAATLEPDDYTHPAWMAGVSARDDIDQYQRFLDLQATLVTLIELFTGSRPIPRGFGQKLLLARVENNEKLKTLLVKTWSSRIEEGKRVFHEQTQDFPWLAGIIRLIEMNQAAASSGDRGIWQSLPPVETLVSELLGSDEEEVLSTFIKASEEKLLLMTVADVDRIVVEWLRSMLRRVQPLYTFFSHAGKKLKWTHPAGHLEITYTIIHFNPGKTIVLGLRIIWLLEKGTFSGGSEEVVISIPLDLYRVFPDEVINQGLIDAQLRRSFISFLIIENTFKEKVPSLHELIVFSSPEDYLDLVSRALDIDLTREKGVIERIAREHRGFIGIIDLLKQLFTISLDGRDYLVKPFRYVEGMTLEAWIRRDEVVAQERKLLADALENFVERTIPWCQVSTPELWPPQFADFDLDDWEILNVFFSAYPFGRSVLLPEEKIELEYLFDNIFNQLEKLADPKADIRISGLKIDSARQQALLAFLIASKEERKDSDLRLADIVRTFISQMVVIRLAMINAHYREAQVIHRDLKPANIMVRPISSAGEQDADVRILDSEGTLWREGDAIDGFFPDALVVITPDYSSPYVLQWLTDHSTQGDRYFTLLLEYDAYSLFIIFFELLVERQELRKIGDGIYDIYCNSVAELIRNPLFLSLLYAPNESKDTFDFSSRDFSDQAMTSELAEALSHDLGINLEAELTSLNDILESGELNEKLRTMIEPETLEKIDMLLAEEARVTTYMQKKHNRWLLSRLYPNLCPPPPVTKQSLTNKYGEYLVPLIQKLDECGELFEQLVIAMAAGLPRNSLTYTLYHWFLVPTGIAKKAGLPRPESASYGVLQYRYLASPNNPRDFRLIERTDNTLTLILKHMASAGGVLTDQAGNPLAEPIPLTPIEAFEIVRKQIVENYIGLSPDF